MYVSAETCVFSIEAFEFIDMILEVRIRLVAQREGRGQLQAFVGLILLP